TSGKSADWRNGAAGSPDSANSDNASSTTAANGQQKNDGEALNSLFARATQNKADAQQNPPPPAPATPAPSAVAQPVAYAAPSPTAPAHPPAAATVKVEPRGRAYLFRGIAGLIYSRGMDKLAERIQHIGLPASVDTYLVWRPIADQAIRDY